MRLKLDLPESFRFSTEIPLRITDMNYGNHLGNDAVLALVHEARVQFLHSLGYSEMNIEGVGIIMTDAMVVFRSEGFYGDTVTVRIATGLPEGTRFDLYSLLENKRTAKEVARVKTGFSCFNYETRRPASIPPPFMRLLTR
jgi:acyl-CoA thioesterase FadM